MNNDLRYLCLFIYTECAYDLKGADYEGRVSRTISGNTCQRWDQQTPWPHSYNNIADFPDDSLDDAANYCRNPGGDDYLWCYTLTEERYEMCDVPCCTGLLT